jgi:hypothetical protein
MELHEAPVRGAESTSYGRSTTIETSLSYAMIMAAILVLVAATVRLIGSNAANTFAAFGSSIAQ